MLRTPCSTLGTIERTRETPSFRLIDTRHGRGLQLKQHAHERAGVTFVLDGAYREHLAGSDVACRRGSVVFKPAAAAHRNVYGTNGAHALHVEIRDTAISDESVSLPDRAIELVGARVAVHIAREFRLNDAASSLALDALAIACVSS